MNPTEKMALFKEFMSLMGCASENGTPETVESSPMTGKYCVIRTYSAGVHIGTLVSKKGGNAVLKDARRLHYWVGAASLSQVAVDGLPDRSDTRFSVPVDLIELDGVIEVIPVSAVAEPTLKGYKQWKM